MFCERCGSEVKEGEKFCSSCGNQLEQSEKKTVKVKFSFLIALIVVCVLLGVIILCKPQKVQIPNLIGMTVEQAEEEMNKIGLKSRLRVTSCGSKKEKIQKQEGPKGQVSKGDYINIYVWTEEYYKKQEKEQAEQKVAERIIEEFASNTRTYNYGSVKYSSFSKYKTTNKGEIVYKIKYTTSYEYMYYYQLVSVDTERETIAKSSRLFLFSKYGSSEETGEKLELEYAYEDLWQ